MIKPEYVVTLLVLLIIAVILIIYGANLGAQGVTSIPDFTLDTPGVWSPPVASPGDVRGGCRVYSFPPDQSEPPVVVNDITVVDQIPPQGLIGCVDDDQLYLKRQQHTCQAKNCRGTDGRLYTPGQIEYFYQSCSAPKCTSTLGFVGLNVNAANPANALCLTKPADLLDTVKVVPCDITNNNQLFRLERFKFDGTPNSLGIYLKIVDRQSGLCVMPSFDKTKLILNDCVESNGVVWALLPSIGYCQNELNSTAPFSSRYFIYDPNNKSAPPVTLPSYPLNRNQPCYNPTTDAYGGFEFLTAPQIMYVTSKQEEPSSLYDLRQLSVSVDPDRLTIQAGADGTAILSHYVGGDATTLAVNTQLIDYYLYDTIINANACQYPFYTVPGSKVGCQL